MRSIDQHYHPSPGTVPGENTQAPQPNLRSVNTDAHPYTA